MHHVRTEGSSQIFSHGYDPVEQALEIKFLCSACKGKESEHCQKCGGKGWSGHYAYEAVPQESYLAMRDHQVDGKASVGAGVNQHIKRSGFKYRKLA